MMAARSCIVPLLLASACATVPPSDLPRLSREPIELCRAGRAESVTLHYLGAGGLVIRVGDEAIMTAPFYSNPGFLRVGLGLPIAPDLARIPERPCALDGARVSALLVGHGHYDHLMDVPHVIEKWKLGRVPVYGSRTVANVLAAARPRVAAVNVDADAGDASRPGSWLPREGGTRFRIMALRSEHAPHFFGIKLFRGHVDAPLTEPPGSAYGWREGQTYAYLVDVLAEDGRTVLLRVHYQDSAANPGIGLPPPDVLADRKVDLVVFCAASFAEVEDHPRAILTALDPRYALAAHWEDFSSASSHAPGVVSHTNLGKLLQQLRDRLGPDQFGVPRPGDRVRFSVCGTGLSGDGVSSPSPYAAGRQLTPPPATPRSRAARWRRRSGAARSAPSARAP
jgi:hypothetical protein